MEQRLAKATYLQAIPEHLRLQPGAQFVVVGQRDAIVLKSICQPSTSEFVGLLKTARRLAKQAGLNKSDVEKAVRKICRK